MRKTRKNQRKALKALALGFATAAQSSRPGIPEGDNYVANHVQSANGSLANQSTRDGGPVFMNGVPDGYVGSGVEQQNLSGEGVTPTNLARSVSQGKAVESATVSASSDSVNRGDLALGFAFGLILAAACAIAVAMTRVRQHIRIRHSKEGRASEGKRPASAGRFALAPV